MISISLSKLCNVFSDKSQVSVLFAHKHGRNLVGDTGDVSLHCFRWRGYNMPCPRHFFLIRFCIWRGFKNKSDVCHVISEELSMLGCI